MKKLSECIAFPKKKDRYYDNYRVIFLKIGEKEKGFDQALKECKDAVDKMELKVDKDFECWLMEYHCENNPETLDDMLPDCFNDWVADLDCEEFLRLGNKYARYIADNLPKLLKEKE